MRNRLLLAYVTFIGACYLTLQYGILENGGAASRQSIRRRRSPHVISRMILGEAGVRCRAARLY